MKNACQDNFRLSEDHYKADLVDRTGTDGISFVSNWTLFKAAAGQDNDILLLKQGDNLVHTVDALIFKRQGRLISF